MVLELLTRPPPRSLLPSVTALSDVVQLIRKCNKILVLTGAGVSPYNECDMCVQVIHSNHTQISVSCGIPDFRSPHGIYAQLAEQFPELPDPQSMFDIHFFKDDPRPFFKFAKVSY